MYVQTVRYTTYSDYPIQYVASPSTGMEEIDKLELRESWLSFLMGIREQPKRQLYQDLSYLFDADPSSVKPHFEIKNEASLIEDIFEKTIPEDMLEFDIVVRIPPIKEWSARVKVKSLEKATPRIVEPEGF